MPTKLNEAGVEQTKAVASKTNRLNKILPTERLSLAKQLEILRAYGALCEPSGGAVTNAAVAKIVGLAPTTISLSNAFFNDVGFIQRGGLGFSPAAEVIAFCHAYEWDQEKAPHKLAPLVNKTWFAQALIPQLKFKPLKIEDAVQVLAETSFADRDYLSQLKMLVDYLIATGVVTSDNVEIRLNRESAQPLQDPPKAGKIEDKKLPGGGVVKQVPEIFTTQEEHSLFLDKEKTKKFSISGPLFISRAEYARICKWIEVTLIVEDEKAEGEK